MIGPLVCVPGFCLHHWHDMDVLYLYPVPLLDRRMIAKSPRRHCCFLKPVQSLSLCVQLNSYILECASSIMSKQQILCFPSKNIDKLVLARDFIHHLAWHTLNPAPENCQYDGLWPLGEKLHFMDCLLQHLLLWNEYFQLNKTVKEILLQLF